MVKAPPGTPDESDAIIRDLKRQIAELRAKETLAQGVASAVQERARRTRSELEAENARLRALPLKDEVERAFDNLLVAYAACNGEDHPAYVAARTLLSRLRAGVQKGWRSMDSAPGDEETPVLLWLNGQWAVGLTWKRRDGTIIGKASMFGNSTAEYWQPLPAAPSERGGDRG